MDATSQVNSVDRTDGAFIQGQFGATGYVSSESASGQRPVPPGCPPPWSPLSPASYNISPQMAPHRQPTVSERTQGPFGMTGSRQFLSAVPMGMYGSGVVSTPMGTSPPRNSSFLTNVMVHQPVMPCAVRGSPGALQPQQAQPLVHAGHYGASPALSDTSSRLSARISGSMNPAMQSPRTVEPLHSTAQRVVKGPAQESGKAILEPCSRNCIFSMVCEVPGNMEEANSAGRCQQASQYALASGSPHQACHVMPMYASASTMMNAQPCQGQNITNLMANAHIGASPRSQTYVSNGQELSTSHAPQAAGPQPGAFAVAGSSVQVFPLQRPSSGKASSQPPQPVPAMQDWNSVLSRQSSSVVSPRQNTDGQAPPAGAPVCTPPVATRAHAQRAPAGANAWAMSGVKQPSSGYPGVALTPAQTLIRYGGVNALTEFEQGEVLHYPQVYYVGAGANKHCPHPSQRALSALCRWIWISDGTVDGCTQTQLTSELTSCP